MARCTFDYQPVVLQQGFCQLALIVCYLIWLENYGQACWNWVVSRYSFQQVFVIGGFSAYFVWFWIWAVPYLLLDQAQAPECLYRYKIQKPGTPVTLHRLAWTVGVVLLNQCLGTFPALYGLFWWLSARGMSADASVPRWWTVLLHFLLSVALEEVLFFSAHYTLHSRLLYPRIHKMHHEYKESIAITTHYVHYIEHLFGNLMPIFSGTFLLGAQAHLFSLGLWVLVAVQNALVTHSGYNFPWLAYSVDHDFHHYSYDGNYGTGLGMDWLFGTDVMQRTLGKAHRDMAVEKKAS